MSEPDFSKQAIEEGAGSVPTEVSAAVGAPSSEGGVAASPREADKRLAPIERAGFSDAVIAALGFIAMVGLAAMAAIYTPTPADQAPLPAAPAAALNAPSLAPAITSAQVAPLPAPDGSGSAAGQPAAYEPVAFAWVIELEDGPYLLTSLGETGSGEASPPRGTNGDEPASYGHAFQSYRGTRPNPAFDALLETRFVLFNGNAQCEAVAEDVGLLAWFTDFNADNAGFTFVARLRAEDGSIPAQPELGLPAFSKDDSEQEDTFDALVKKDPTLTARITMQAAKKVEYEGSYYYPQHSAVKLRIISNGEACSHVGESWVGRSAELPPILVTSPSWTTKKALGLDKARLWPSSKEIDKTCGWRGRKPLRREFDFNAQPDALTWTTGDGTEYAWADYRKGWEGQSWESDWSCKGDLIIEVFWKRKLGAKRWTRELIFKSPDDNDYSGPDSSYPPFLIVDMKDGKVPSVICGDSYHCLANSNGQSSEPPKELFLNDT